MQKLQIKTKITLFIKRFPHYIALGLALVVVIITVLLYLPSQRGKASGGYDFLRKVPNVSYSIQAPEAIASDDAGNVYVHRRSPESGVIKIGSDGQYLGELIGSSQLPNDVYGLATDSSGNIYATQYDGIIKKFSSAGSLIDTIQLDGINDGNYNEIGGIAIDSQDRLYVTDYYRQKVQVFDADGNFIFKWGTYGSGDGEFVGLKGIAIDSQDNIFVVDESNNRVQKFDVSGVYISKWGTYGSGDGQFQEPSSVFVDSVDDIYVTDNNYRIQKFSGDGTYQTHWGGYSALPKPGKFGGMFDGSSGYSRIWGAATASGVYITDYYGYRVQKFDTDGQYINEFGEHSPGQMKSPAGLALDASGNSYVVDWKNYRIQKFDPNGGYVRQWGTQGSGDGEFSGNGNRVLVSVAVDKQNGFVYVADEGNLRIQKFDLDGNFKLAWGSSGSGDGQFKWDNISSGTGSVAVDSSGYVYVSDHERIQKFNGFGVHQSSFSTVSGVGVITAAVDGSIYARTGSAIYRYSNTGSLQRTIGWQSESNATFDGITTDQYGDIYLSSGYGITKLNAAGQYLTEFGGQGVSDGQFTSPSGIAVKDNGTLLVSDEGGWPTGRESNRIQEFQDNTRLSIDTSSLPGGAVGSYYNEQISTSGSHGVISFSVSSGSLPPGLSINSTTGRISGTPSVGTTRTFTVMAQDSLYTATKQFMVTVPTVATLPDVSTSSAGGINIDSADMSGATSPKGVTHRGFEYGTTTSYGSEATDSSQLEYRLKKNWGSQGSGDGQFLGGGDMAISNDFSYVSDGIRIQKFDSDGNFVSKWGSQGSGDGQFWGIDGIAEMEGYIYAVDTGNNRIQKFDSDGNFVSKWGSQGSGDGQFDLPRKIEAHEGALLVVDTNNRRIQKFDDSGVFLSSIDFPVSSGTPANNTSSSLAISTNDDIFAYDSKTGNMYKFDPEGGLVASWVGYDGGDNGNTQLAYEDIAVVGSSLYAAYTSGIQQYNLFGQYVGQWGQFGTGDGEFYTPTGLGVTQKQDLYVHNGGNYRVEVFSGSIVAEASNLVCETNYHFRAFATNSVGTSYGEDKTFTTADCPSADISITTTSLPDGQVDEAYSSSIETQGGQGAKTFSIINGALPNGVSLDSSTGSITGTPTQSGDFTFMVNVVDDFSADSAVLQIHVASLVSPLSISTNVLANGEVGTAYSQDIDVNNPIGSVEFTVTVGALPTGLMIAADTGVISGTPLTADEYTFTVTATDTYSTDSRQYTVVISPGSDTNGDLISISTLTLPDGKVGAAYSQPIEVSTPTGDVTYGVSSGVLPDGLSIGSSNGTISGTPTDAGIFDFTVIATDDNGSDLQDLQIEVKPADAVMYIITKSLADGRVGNSYDQDILVKNSSGATTYSVTTGTLPTGLSLSKSGTISGKPTNARSYEFTIRAVDSRTSDSQKYSILVNPAVAINDVSGTKPSKGAALATDGVIARELDEIALRNESLARPIGAVARRFKITPKEVVYGLPWVVISLFALFTALSASRAYADIRIYKNAKKRQEFHRQLIEEKTVFISLASHYLRTPISIIKGGVELIGKASSRALTGVQVAGGRLTKAVNDVIDRLEKGGRGE